MAQRMSGFGAALHIPLGSDRYVSTGRRAKSILIVFRCMKVAQIAGINFAYHLVDLI